MMCLGVNVEGLEAYQSTDYPITSLQLRLFHYLIDSIYKDHLDY